MLWHLLLQWVEEPTLLVTRFEYANLFHTITDWYSAYVSSRVTDLPNRPNVVFVDGHCKVCDALCVLLLVQCILFVTWVMTNQSVSSAIIRVNNIGHISVVLIVSLFCALIPFAWSSSCFSSVPCLLLMFGEQLQSETVYVLYLWQIAHLLYFWRLPQSALMPHPKFLPFIPMLPCLPNIQIVLFLHHLIFFQI